MSPARPGLWPLCVFLLFPLLQPSPAPAGQQLFRQLHSTSREMAKDLVVRDKPETSRDDCIEQLAREIDWLEAYLDQYGSVVAKHPDVWGESRLTKFRNEYERELSRRLSSFQPRDNAAILRSDLAFLSSATGLGMAIDNRTPSTVNLNASATPAGGGAAPAADPQAQTPSVPDVPPPAISQQITWNPLSTSRGAMSAARNLEPTTELDQLSRYVNHLHELRRINEGDDTSDSPGYSLNLVRIPVSVNPGRETRRGHGAEITVTATPHLSNTLLPETFRSLVINDLVDQLALPVLKLAEHGNLAYTRAVQLFNLKHGREIARIEEITRDYSEASQTTMVAILQYVFEGRTSQQNLALLDQLVNDASGILREKSGDGAEQALIARIDEIAGNIKYVVALEAGRGGAERNYILATASDGQKDVMLRLARESVQAFDSSAFNPDDPKAGFPKLFAEAPTFSGPDIRDQKMNALVLVRDLFGSLFRVYELDKVAVNPVTRRRSSLPIPQVLLEPVVGRVELVEIATVFRNSYSGRYVAWNGDPAMPPVHLADVRHYLQSNLRGACDLLSQPEHRALLEELIEPGLTPQGLAAAVRNADETTLEYVRQRLNGCLQPGSGTTSIMVRLCWPVIVEMALLNDQLNRDVHDIAVTRGDCGCHPAERQAYYLPMPVDHEAEQGDSRFLAATRAFQEYVRCRWPILVFHIDPVNEEQNVQDSSMLSRELAVAAAVSLSSGRMSFQQANQFSRQYQEQIEAIGLNRTVSGFTHGNDTFGWRFRPRVQTHPNRSTMAAFRESLVGRHPDANLREAAIEAGMRECTAIVLMPSFVPYCDFDVRSNWFRLDNPRASDLSMHQSMKLSRSIRQMQDCSLQCALCAHLYRDGEPERLLKRVHQLGRELPLQSMRVQIPYENTLGGFEMFSNGVTDLSPELVGWYGAPGIILGGEACCSSNCSPPPAPAANAGCHCPTTPSGVQGKGTTVFLVGDNFSTHETQIIAGGIAIPGEHVRLISRQVLQVTVPRCVETVVFDGIEHVAIHAATPYGVTSHLHIPVRKASSPAEPANTQLATLSARVDELTRIVGNTSFAWVRPLPLPVAHSFSKHADGRYFFSCPETGSIDPATTWVLGRPTSPLPPLPFRVVGRFSFRGEAVGDAFWIGCDQPPGDGSFSIPASALVASFSAVLGSLPVDRFGNNPETELALHAHVVFVRECPQPGAPPELACNPVPVVNTIRVLLQRRSAPPASQLCNDPAPQPSAFEPEPIESPRPLPGHPAEPTGLELPQPGAQVPEVPSRILLKAASGER